MMLLQNRCGDALLQVPDLHPFNLLPANVNLNEKNDKKYSQCKNQ